MGANATTFVPTYVAGEVLTAANLKVTNSGIPVFADSTARDAAFGGTGEKTLAEGQYAYLESTNATQYYDGSAWVAVGASGLTYITGATFTTVASVSLPANTFSSTYRNYKIIFDITASSATAAVTVRLRASGTDNTTTSYRLESPGVTVGNATNNATQDNATSWAFGSGFLHQSFDILAPQATALTAAVGSYVEQNASAIIGRALAANFVATTSFDSMSWICASGTFSGVYRVYGYSES